MADDALPAPEPGKVAVSDPDTGKVLFIDQGDLAQAAEAGFKPLGRSDALAGLKNEYMQSGVGQLATGAAGFLRGLSGGLSDLGLAKSGAIEGQDLGALSELNPGTSTVGHGAGFLASMLVPGAGEGAAGAEAAGGLAGLGRAAAGGAPGLLAGLGGLAERSVGKGLAGTLARGAVEGAGFQVADNLTEDVFHDKDLTAESLLAHTGPAAMLGAAGGVAFEKLLGLAGKTRALDALGEKIEELGDKFGTTKEGAASRYAAAAKSAIETADEATSQLTKVRDTAIREALENRPVSDEPLKFADVIRAKLDEVKGASGYAKAAREVADTLDESLLGAKNAHEQFVAVDQAKRELGKLSKFDKDTTVSLLDRDGLKPIRDAWGASQKYLEDTGAWGDAGAIQAKANKALSPFINDAGEKSGFAKSLFSKAQDSAELQDAAIGNKVADEVKAYNQLRNSAAESGTASIRGARSDALVDNLLDGLQHAHETATDIAASLKSGNVNISDVKAAINEMRQAHEAGVNAFSKNGAANLVESLPVVGKTFGVIRKAMDGQGEKIAKVAGYAAEVTKAISAGVRTALSGASSTAGRDLLAAEAPNIGHWLDFDKVAAHNTDPAALTNTLAENTDKLQRHAPTVALSAQGAAVRATQYLGSIAPKNPVPPSGLPGQAKFTPSPTELHQYKQAATAIERPLSVLEGLRTGNLSSAQVKAMSAVFPALYAKVCSETMAALTERKEPVPYKQQLALSTLLQRPVGFTQEHLAPLFQATPQAKPPEAQAPQGQRPSKTGMGKIKLADASATGLQRAALGK